MFYDLVLTIMSQLKSVSGYLTQHIKITYNGMKVLHLRVKLIENFLPGYSNEITKALIALNEKNNELEERIVQLESKGRTE